MLTGTHKWSKSILKRRHCWFNQIVLEWKELMVTYCHFSFVFVTEHDLCMSACACCIARNLQGVPVFVILIALLCRCHTLSPTDPLSVWYWSFLLHYSYVEHCLFF
jgi:hypothetical protein